MNFLEQTSFREATPKGPDFFRSAELDSVDPKSGIPSTIQHCAPSHNKLHDLLHQPSSKPIQSPKRCSLSSGRAFVLDLCTLQGRMFDKEPRLDHNDRSHVDFWHLLGDMRVLAARGSVELLFVVEQPRGL